VSDVLETWVVLHLRVLHHGVLGRCWCPALIPLITAFIVIIVVASTRLVGEVGRAFVFVRATVLRLLSVFIVHTFHTSADTPTYILEPAHNLVDVR